MFRGSIRVFSAAATKNRGWRFGATHTIDFRGEPIECLDSDKRVRAMLEGAKAVPGVVRRQGESRTVLLEQMVRQVHDGAYLDFLQRASESLPRDQTLYDHPYFAHGLDRETGVVRGTYATALSSATQALSTALSVLDGGTAMAVLRQNYARGDSHPCNMLHGVSVCY
jgi:acetoin utilization deacetylase AcuC-like enzyme